MKEQIQTSENASTIDYLESLVLESKQKSEQVLCLISQDLLVFAAFAMVGIVRHLGGFVSSSVGGFPPSLVHDSDDECAELVRS